MIGIVLFITALCLLFIGYPIAFTFAGVSLLFGWYSMGADLFAFMPYRIMSIMQNTILMAVPLFIFMGIVLQKSRLAERLLESMAQLFGEIRGGLAISTIIVGAFLAASTGVVGASVVAMGVISLPVMMKYNYDKQLATGVIVASGTLGQIIPPSIILIILGDVMGLPVGDLFQAALWPGVALIVSYILYTTYIAWRHPERAPAIPVANIKKSTLIIQALKSIFPPLFLIVAVLGSIFTGIATPTESAALGGVGAIFLSLFSGNFKLSMILDSAKETTKVTAMVFAVLIGATAFSMVFTYSGGDYLVEEFMLGIPGEKWTFIALAMLAIFILGFFIDFVEIAFIIVPILTPIAESLGVNMVWFAILIAMNLQSSFLTPPFGFSLFYLKGVAPKGITTVHIYKGVIPFIILQMLVLTTLVVFPEVFGLSSQ
ncbi:MAG: TRAP transporter large permease subunit [Gammaproteobacteria bacterium]|nr:TRAP transporter large permease subunit [Gammaproteobacteria bacterium]